MPRNFAGPQAIEFGMYSMSCFLLPRNFAGPQALTAAFFILHEFEQVDQSIKLVGFISRHTIRVIVAERTLVESAVGWVHRM